jgi:hypothetical protein
MVEFSIPRHSRGKRVSGDIERLEDENWLRHRYINDGMSVGEIAKELGLSLTPVRRYMQKYGIEFREYSEATRLRHTPLGSKLRNKDWMVRKYEDEYWSTVDIANATDTTPQTAQRWLEYHGIPIRSFVESTSLAKTESAVPELYDEEYMRQEYIEKQKIQLKLRTISELALLLCSIGCAIMESNYEHLPSPTQMEILLH